MNIVDQATQTQLSNIEKRTGKSLKQLFDLVGASGLNKPGQVRDMLKRKQTNPLRRSLLVFIPVPGPLCARSMTGSWLK